MLEIKKVTKKYGQKTAIKDISLAVNEGEIFGFVGPNGAGKTTLIKSVVGIHKFDQGDILIEGISIKENEINSNIEALNESISQIKILIASVPENSEQYIIYTNKLNELENKLNNLLTLKTTKEKIDQNEKTYNENINNYNHLYTIYQNGL